MLIIVGLGNPGKKFEKTRHNAGFMALDFFAKENGFPKFKPNSNGFYLFSEKDGVTLVKPQTIFMNDSGKIAEYYKDEISNLVIVHDDIDIPLGKRKFSQGGSSGGHKGVESIIQHLRTDNFTRLKIGIATGDQAAKEVVLEKFSPQEQEIMDSSIKIAAQALKYLAENGLEKTMNEYNR